MVRSVVRVPKQLPSSDGDFAWPYPSFIAKVQQGHTASRPDEVVLSDHFWTFKDTGATWIPDIANDPHLRLLFIAHFGPFGHRGAGSTEEVLSKSHSCSILREDIRSFVPACIHCLSTVGGEKIPRTFGPAVHVTKGKYVLILGGCYSVYKWFFGCPNTNAENAATAIIEWCAAFCVPNGVISTHFPNEVVRLVSKGIKVPHHFTLSYCPWSNGEVERLDKELIYAARPVMSELKMSASEWQDLHLIFT